MTDSNASRITLLHSSWCLITVDFLIALAELATEICVQVVSLGSIKPRFLPALDLPFPFELLVMSDVHTHLHNRKDNTDRHHDDLRPQSFAIERQIIPTLVLRPCHQP